MPDDARSLPEIDTAALPALPTATMPLALQIFFNDRLFDRCRLIAKYMAEAEGAMPRHLLGKHQACFAIVSRALTWNLDPYAVAQATYQTPNGQVGYYGSLCQAIIENSGRLEGGVKFKHFGDWSKIQRKFRIAENQKGNKYPVPNWPDDAEEDVGVLVSATVKGEAEPRELEFYLSQAWPRNSTLWATDPMTQIKYTAVRRFATSVAPTLFMGVPFDRETDWGDALKDVTPPRPSPEQFLVEPRPERQSDEPPAQTQSREPDEIFVLVLADRSEVTFANPEEAADAMETEMRARAKESGWHGSEGVWERNGRLISDLRSADRHDLAEGLHKTRNDLTVEHNHYHGPREEEPARSTEHPGEQESSTIDRKEDPAVVSPDTPGSALRDAPTRAPRDDEFWSRVGSPGGYALKGKTPKEMLYYAQRRLRECRDEFEVNGIEADNAAVFAQMSPRDRAEFADLIAQRRRELPQ